MRLPGRGVEAHVSCGPRPQLTPRFDKQKRVRLTRGGLRRPARAAPGARYARRPLAGAPPRAPGLSPLRGPGPAGRISEAESPLGTNSCPVCPPLAGAVALTVESTATRIVSSDAPVRAFWGLARRDVAPAARRLTGCCRLVLRSVLRGRDLWGRRPVAAGVAGAQPLVPFFGSFLGQARKELAVGRLPTSSAAR